MSKAVEQLKHRAKELSRQPQQTIEHIDALNEAAWEIRNTDNSLMRELSREALQLAVCRDYERGRAFALRAAGWSQFRNEQYQQAAQTLTESRKTFGSLRVPERAGLASTINILAFTQKYLGDYEAALANCSTALQLHEKAGDYAGMALVFGNLGGLHYHFGDYAQALDYCYRALQAITDSHLPISKAHIYNNLGNILWRVGEPEMAIEQLAQAISLLQEHQDRHSEATGWINLGAAEQSQKDYRKALENYSRGLKISKAINNFEAQAEAGRSLGSLHLECGEVQAAFACLEPALQLARKTQFSYEESEILLQLGSAYMQIGNETEGLKAFEQALAISDQLGYNQVRVKAHFGLSGVFEKRGQPVAALAHYQDFYRFSQAIIGAAPSRRIERLLSQNQTSGVAQNDQQQLIRHHRSADQALANRAPRSILPPHKIHKINEFINQHLDQNVTLAMLADVARLNRDHFIRSFKRTTNKTPHQFLLEQRISRAKLLLQTTALPLAEIALRCGFNSQPHLTTQFRLSTGFTPHQFRQFSA